MLLPLSVRRRVLRLAFAFAAAIPLSVLADAVPTGNETLFLGAARLGDQIKPAVAMTEAGGYVVWQDNSISKLGSRIRVQRIAPDGSTQGGAVTVSSAWKSKATRDQENCDVAALLNGAGAAVVWQGGKVGFQQVYLRLLGANGSPIKKSDIRVSKQTKRSQSDPRIATLTDGTLLVVWTSYGQDGSMFGVFGQKFTPAGAKIGTEFQINEFAANNQRSPAVTALPNGEFAVAWISELQRGEATIDVIIRRFDSSGTPLSSESVVNVGAVNICANPAIAASNEGFMVAWSEKDNGALAIGSPEGMQVVSTNGIIGGVSSTTRSGASWDVLGRRYAFDGSPASDVFLINSTLWGDQYGPSIAGGSTGYLVAWNSLGQDGSREGVFGQSYTVSGAADGGEFQVNSMTTNRQWQPATCISTGNEALVIWSGFAPRVGFELFIQRYGLSTP